MREIWAFTGIVFTAVAMNAFFNWLFLRPKKREPKSARVILGNGWGIYDGEFVEGRYDI